MPPLAAEMWREGMSREVCASEGERYWEELGGITEKWAVATLEEGVRRGEWRDGANERQGEGTMGVACTSCSSVWVERVMRRGDLQLCRFRLFISSSRHF